MEVRSDNLLLDLYQLTMAQSYFLSEMQQPAVFELFTRQLPQSRHFLIAAGLEQVVDYLENLHFSGSDIEYLAGTRLFCTRFLDYLAGLRFSGSLHAMPEGTPFFANEPIVRITAPIIEAQLVESRILNIVHFQTLIASKAVRCVLAGGGRRMVDFGMRRAHEADAAVFAARAAYLAGFDATATVEAGRRFDIPLSGTMAHSFIEAHEREEAAFREFVTSCSGEATLLVDTYDTRRATERVGKLVRERAIRGEPSRIRAIRIDSGNLADDARAARSILDRHLCHEVEIVLSGGLDEQGVAELVRANVPVDAFGIGTALAVSADAPALDMAYKLQEYAGKPRRKRSPGKATWPGTKQVFREHDIHGQLRSDSVGLDMETLPGQRLLVPVLEEGRRVVALPGLRSIRESCARQVSHLPRWMREITRGGEDWEFEVRISDELLALTAHFDATNVC
jgi:nicotinate phosphoribosyltransferase